jgi:hypothetical protein
LNIPRTDHVVTTADGGVGSRADDRHRTGLEQTGDLDRYVPARSFGFHAAEHVDPG